ncbi:hypothetical protein [Streptomyces sp. NBC_00212]|uniref:hypothetical protein n=1 Tax=Streptomyces sp. NBC_00212 TaxID=2975684 RepID=UPI00324D1897
MDKARADLPLVAGGDDPMWPSVPFAEQLAQRWRSAATSVGLITRHDVGHRPCFSGESPGSASPRFQHGGTPEADALLETAAWPCVLDALRNSG